MAAPSLSLSLVPQPVRHSLRECITEVDNLIELIESLDDPDGELAPGATEVLQQDLITALCGTKSKVDTTCAVMARFDAEAALVKTEIARLKSRGDWLERQQQRISDYVIATLTASAIPKIDGNTSSLSLRKNPPAVWIDPVILKDAESMEAHLGWDYLKLPDAPDPTVDKTALKAALKAGAEIAGVELRQSVRLVRS